MKTLDANADGLEANPNQLVRIDGNSDARGTKSTIWPLGERPKAAMSYLVSTGHRRGSDYRGVLRPWASALYRARRELLAEESPQQLPRQADVARQAMIEDEFSLRQRTICATVTVLRSDDPSEEK